MTCMVMGAISMYLVIDNKGFISLYIYIYIRDVNEEFSVFSITFF